jgi:hypothetical protein
MASGNETEKWWTFNGPISNERGLNEWGTLLSPIFLLLSPFYYSGSPGQHFKYTIPIAPSFSQIKHSSAGLRVGRSGFDSRRGLRIFVFTTASKTALGPTQLPIRWVPGALSLGVMRPGREADHSPPSSSEVKEWVELYIHSPNTP